MKLKEGLETHPLGPDFKNLSKLTPFNEFLATRRTVDTRRTYSQVISRCLKDPDAFLEKAKQDKRGAEDYLIFYITPRRDRLSSATLGLSIAATRSFLEYWEVPLNWKRVKATIGPVRAVARDRAPTVEEIRKLLDVADLRMKTAILILASAGMRITGLLEMELGHVQFLDSGIARVSIYANSNEEYNTFISAEAVQALHNYLASREQVGEKLTPSSPLMRNVWQFANNSRRLDPTIPKFLTRPGFSYVLGDLWVASGVRTRHKDKKVEFKTAHGFRKFFKTQADQGVRSRDDVEVLMGHILNYYKPTLEHLEEAYLGAVPYLTISEVEEVKKYA